MPILLLQGGGITMADTSVDTLNSFLRGEISAVESYQQAIDRLKDSDKRAQLEQAKASHEARVMTLRNYVAARGGEPASGSGPWGAFTKLFEGGAKLFGEKAAIAALEEGEDHGLRLYRDDIKKLDSTARQLVETDILPEQQRTHATLSALKHSMH
jgi:uncharacterized protein (TIGR02284 family)